MHHLKFAAQGLHYGQAVFEGLKAYKYNDEVVLFRPDENFKRINNSLARLKCQKWMKMSYWKV